MLFNHNNGAQDGHWEIWEVIMNTPGSVKQQIFFRKRLLTINLLPMKQWISLNPSKLMPTNNDENTVTENIKIFFKTETSITTTNAQKNTRTINAKV